jgi:hypothetical protein
VNTFYHFFTGNNCGSVFIFLVFSSGNFSKEKAGRHLGKVFVSKGGKPSLDEIEPQLRLISIF